MTNIAEQLHEMNLQMVENHLVVPRLGRINRAGIVLKMDRHGRATGCWYGAVANDLIHLVRTHFFLNPCVYQKDVLVWRKLEALLTEHGLNLTCRFDCCTLEPGKLGLSVEDTAQCIVTGPKQDVGGFHLLPEGRSLGDMRRNFIDWKVDREMTADVRFTFNFDGSTKFLDHFPGHAQADAKTFVMPRMVVFKLTEWFKNTVDMFSIDADASILNPDLQIIRITHDRQATDVDDDLSLRCELDGITQQACENLG